MENKFDKKGQKRKWLLFDEHKELIYFDFENSTNT